MHQQLFVVCPIAVSAGYQDILIHLQKLLWKPCTDLHQEYQDSPAWSSNWGEYPKRRTFLTEDNTPIQRILKYLHLLLLHAQKLNIPQSEIAIDSSKNQLLAVFDPQSFPLRHVVKPFKIY